MKLSKPVFQSQECLNQDEILLYLEGKAEDEIRYRIENHLLDCPLCSAAIEGLSGHDTDDLTQDFEFLQEAVEARVAENSNEALVTQRRNIWTLNRIAAAVLLLVIPAAALVYWNAQNSQGDIIAQIESPSEIVEGLRSAELLPEVREYKIGLDQFQQGDFDSSLRYFENIYEIQPENSFARFYAGISALQLGETDKAIEQLSIVRFNDKTYYEHASYYLILAHARKGNEKEAKGLIEDLLKIEGSFYAEKAKKLLETFKE